MKLHKEIRPAILIWHRPAIVMKSVPSKSDLDYAAAAYRQIQISIRSRVGIHLLAVDTIRSRRSYFQIAPLPLLPWHPQDESLLPTSSSLSSFCVCRCTSPNVVPIDIAVSNSIVAIVHSSTASAPLHLYAVSSKHCFQWQCRLGKLGSSTATLVYLH